MRARAAVRHNWRQLLPRAEACFCWLARAQAQSAQGTTIPVLSPDICLINYYEKTGRLGLHQVSPSPPVHCLPLAAACLCAALRCACGAPPPTSIRNQSTCGNGGARHGTARAAWPVRQARGVPGLLEVQWGTACARAPGPQDKDESSESLRKGIPVVSFSIGDTADFVLARSHDEVGPGVRGAARG